MLFRVSNSNARSVGRIWDFLAKLAALPISLSILHIHRTYVSFFSSAKLFYKCWLFVRITLWVMQTDFKPPGNYTTTGATILTLRYYCDVSYISAPVASVCDI